jgi:biotin transporter BioY
MIQKNTKKRMMITVAFLAPVIVALIGTPVFADCETGILPVRWCDDTKGLQYMIADIIRILSALVWVLGGVFIVICGVIWMTAMDDPGKVATAKKRILEIVVGMIAFLAIDLIIYWLGIAD